MALPSSGQITLHKFKLSLVGVTSYLNLSEYYRDTVLMFGQIYTCSLLAAKSLCIIFMGRKNTSRLQN